MMGSVCHLLGNSVDNESDSTNTYVVRILCVRSSSQTENKHIDWLSLSKTISTGITTNSGVVEERHAPGSS
jgi:hypothetical protein